MGDCNRVGGGGGVWDDGGDKEPTTRRREVRSRSEQRGPSVESNRSEKLGFRGGGEEVVPRLSSPSPRGSISLWVFQFLFYFIYFILIVAVAGAEPAVTCPPTATEAFVLE